MIYKKYSPEDWIQSLSSRLKKGGTRDGNCFLWNGAKNLKGYGCIRYGKKTLFTHRAAWLVHYGSLPEKLCLHTCDRPSCYEISHLWEGTANDNTQDMLSKGREHGPKNPKYGSEHPNALITENDAKNIASLLSKGLNCVEISKQLNISTNIIFDIKRRKTWNHVDFTIPKKKEYKKNCLICGTEFKTKAYNFMSSKYCTHKCYSKSLEKEKDFITCLGCGKGYLLKSIKNEKRKYCSIHCHKISNRGEKSPSSKLNNNNILEIRQLLKEGLSSCAAIARRFSVSSITIRNIRDGKKWKHLT